MGFWDDVGDFFEPVGDGLSDAADQVAQWGGELIDAAVDFGGDIVGLVGAVGADVLNALGEAGNLVLEFIGDLLGIKFVTSGTCIGDGDNELIIGLDFGSAVELIARSFETIFSSSFWSDPAAAVADLISDVTQDSNSLNIHGRGGNDVILAFGASTRLHGDSGNDWILGLSAVQTFIRGGSGNDFMIGAALINDLAGGSGNDTIIAALGGSNILRGDSGNDFITSVGISNDIQGGADNDTVIALGGGNVVIGDDAAYALTGNDVLIVGGIAVNFVHGGRGDDIIATAAAANFLYGGSNDDVIVALGIGNIIYGDANGGDAFGSGIDSNVAGAGDDVIVAFAGGNLLYAEGGDDVIVAVGAANLILAGDGDDVAVSLGGVNLSLGGDGDDVQVSLGVGGDLMLGGGGEDVIVAASQFGNFTAGGDDNDVVIALSGGLNIVFGDALPFVFGGGVEGVEAFGQSLLDFGKDLFDDLDLGDFEFEDLSLPTLPTLEDFDFGSLDILGNLVDSGFLLKLVVPDFLLELGDDEGAPSGGGSSNALSFENLNLLATQLDPELAGFSGPSFDLGSLVGVPDLGLITPSILNGELDFTDPFGSPDLDLFDIEVGRFDGIESIDPSQLGSTEFDIGNLVLDQVIPDFGLPDLTLDTSFLDVITDNLPGVPSFPDLSLGALGDLGIGLPDLSGGGDPDEAGIGVENLTELSLPSSRSLSTISESFAATQEAADGKIYRSGTGRGDVSLPPASLPALSLPTFDLFDRSDLGSDILVSISQLNLMFAGDGSDLVVAAGNTNIQFGQDGSDIVVGVGGGNLLFAGDQDDIVVGLGFANLLSGGRGNDIMGGVGKFNVMAGASGDDVMLGGGLLNILLGGSGSDILAGAGKFNGFVGGADNDLLVGGGLFNVMLGGAGDDIVVGGGKLNTLLAGDGNDVVIGFGKFNLLSGGEGDDLMLGGGTLNVMDGDVGDDIILGGGKFNLMLARGGNDIVVGGGKFNTIFAGEGTDIVAGAGKFNTIFAGADNDIVIGGGRFNTILAGAGDDLVGGGGKFNTMLGGAGADLLIGGGKLNTMLGQFGADVLLGGGPGTLQSGGLDNDILIGIGIDETEDPGDGGGGGDTGGGSDLDFKTDFAATLYGDFGSDLMLGAGAFVEMYGGAGHDFMFGGAFGVSQLFGGDGFDFMLSLGLLNIMDGGDGNDILVGVALLPPSVEGRAAGVLDSGDFQGGAGNDLVYAVGFDIEVFGDEAPFLGIPDAGAQSEGAADLLVTGGSGNSVFGGGGDDVAILFGGFHFAQGGGGNDRIVAIGPANELHGGDGDDTLVHAGPRGSLHGGDGSDLLLGRGMAMLDWLDTEVGSEVVALFSDGLDLIGANLEDFFDITVDFFTDPLEFDGSAIEMVHFFAGIGDDTDTLEPEIQPDPNTPEGQEAIREAEQEILETFIFNVLDEVQDKLGSFLAAVDSISFNQLLPNWGAGADRLLEREGGPLDVDTDLGLDFGGFGGTLVIGDFIDSLSIGRHHGDADGDFLFGGVGIHKLLGGAGDDLYTHFVGDGIQIIDEEGAGGLDELVFDASRASGLSFTGGVLGQGNLQTFVTDADGDGAEDDLEVKLFDDLGVWSGTVLIVDQGVAGSNVERISILDAAGIEVDSVDLDAAFASSASTAEASVTAAEFANVVEASSTSLIDGLGLVGSIADFFGFQLFDLVESAVSSTGEGLEALVELLSAYFTDVEEASTPLLGLGGSEDVDEMFDGDAFPGAPGIPEGFTERIETLGESTLRTTRFVLDGIPRIEVAISPISLDLDAPVSVSLFDGRFEVELPPGLGLELSGAEADMAAGGIADPIATLLEEHNESNLADALVAAQSAALAAESLEAAGTDALVEALELFTGEVAPDSQVALRFVTFASLEGATPGAPLVIRGTEAALEALVVDASGLPAGVSLQLDHIDFAHLLGSVGVVGGDGRNIYAGDGAAQRLAGGEDSDALFGGGGNDLLFGEAGDDLLVGGADDDVLMGDMSSASVAPFTVVLRALAHRTGGELPRVQVRVDGELVGEFEVTAVRGIDEAQEFVIELPEVWRADSVELSFANDRPRGSSVENEGISPTMTLAHVNRGLVIESLAVNGRAIDIATADLTRDSGGPGGDVQLTHLLFDVSSIGPRVDLTQPDAFAEGNDDLRGGHGLDLLVGGGGDDRASGGMGADTYLVQAGFGHDTIDEQGDADSGIADRLVLADSDGTDIRLAVTNRGDDLQIRVGTDLIDVLGQFDADGPGQRVEILELGNGNAYEIVSGRMGSTAADALVGGDRRDVLQGRQGDDLIAGGAGNDLLFGHQGDDLLIGDLGNDQLNGQHGDDLLRGDEGDDNLLGGVGNDTLLGGAGDDVLAGDTSTVEDEGEDGVGDGNPFGFDDMLSGGAGADLLEGNQGDDVLLGGDGDDRVFGDSEAGVFAGDGNDVLEGGAGNDLLAGGGGDDVVHGGDDDDEIFGGLPGLPDGGSGSDDDQLFGDAGDDVLTGGDGDDFVDGGSGVGDVAVFRGARSDYEITRQGDSIVIRDLDAVRDGDDGTDTLRNVEIARFLGGDEIQLNSVLGGTDDRDVVVAEDSGAHALNLVLPEDSEGDALSVRVGSVPSGGRVEAGDGTRFEIDDFLTEEQYESLLFVPDLDFNGDAGALQIVISDGVGSTAFQTVRFEVTSVDDAPGIAAAPLQLAEDGSVSLDTISISDADSPDGSAQVRVTLTPSRGAIRDPASGATASFSAQGSIASLNLVIATLSYEAAADDFGALDLEIRVEELDGAGLTSERTVSIDIDPVNDAPVLQGPPGPLVTPEGIAVAIPGLSVSDVEIEAGLGNGNITVSLRPDEGALELSGVAPASVQVTVVPPTAGLGAGLDLTGPLADINAALALIQFVPGDFVGDVTIVVEASDLGNFPSPEAMSAGLEVQVEVSADNLAPLVEPERVFHVPYDAGEGPLNIFVPADPENGPLTVTVDSVPGANEGTVYRPGASPAAPIPVAVGDTLSVEDLTSLTFVVSPTVETLGVGLRAVQAGFSYTVSDADGGSTPGNVQIVVVDDEIESIVPGTDPDGNPIDIVTIVSVPLDVQGGEGNDVLIGGDDDDTITPGGGIDFLGGGAGADTFVFGPDSGPRNAILDFDATEDMLQLDGIGLATVDPIQSTDFASDGILDTVLHFDDGGELILVGVENLLQDDLVIV